MVATGTRRVRGVAEGPVAAFRGIPYAASPVGELRLAPLACERYVAQRPGATPARVHTDLADDRVFRGGGMQVAAHRTGYGLLTCVYRFARRPEPDDHDLGATHCAELPFLFRTFGTFRDAPMPDAVNGHDHDLADRRPYGPGPDPHVMRLRPEPG